MYSNTTAQSFIVDLGMATLLSNILIKAGRRCPLSDLASRFLVKASQLQPPDWLKNQPPHRWRRNVYVNGTTHNGQGVFARRAFQEGARVLVFRGPRKSREEFADPNEWEHALQIDFNLYLGPSGGEDDFVNHSCNPNTYLKGRQTLMALRDIAPDEEITMDYATLTEEPDWQMNCHCGAPNCRGLITSFSRTPEPLKQQRHFQTWLSKR